MNARVFTQNGDRFYRAADGETFDQIALSFFGRTAGATEALMDANPDVPQNGAATFEAGDVVKLPRLATSARRRPTRLFE